MESPGKVKLKYGVVMQYNIKRDVVVEISSSREAKLDLLQIELNLNAFKIRFVHIVLMQKCIISDLM